jgi:hypothetical protein
MRPPSPSPPRASTAAAAKKVSHDEYTLITISTLGPFHALIYEYRSRCKTTHNWPWNACLAGSCPQACPQAGRGSDPRSVCALRSLFRRGPLVLVVTPCVPGKRRWLSLYVISRYSLSVDVWGGISRAPEAPHAGTAEQADQGRQTDHADQGRAGAQGQAHPAGCILLILPAF